MDSSAEYSQWLGILDEMERNLQRQAHDPDWIEAENSDWQPPRRVGPLPAELADRAHHVLSRQHETMSDLRDAQAEVGRHREALRQIPGQDRALPTYLDTAG